MHVDIFLSAAIAMAATASDPTRHSSASVNNRPISASNSRRLPVSHGMRIGPEDLLCSKQVAFGEIRRMYPAAEPGPWLHDGSCESYF